MTSTTVDHKIKKMKRILLPFLLLMMQLQFSVAQTDAKAKAILTQVGKKYRSYQTIKASFIFTTDNPQASLKEREEGELYTRPSENKYRVQLPGQEQISDGKSVWVYQKENKEVQVSDADNGEDNIGPAKLFTFYEKGFKYIYTGEARSGNKVVQVIDLSPLDIKKPYFKIRLSIDKATSQIQNFTIFDKNGNKYGYAIKVLTPNVKVPESTFSFDAKKYPGVEVVDLR